MYASPRATSWSWATDASGALMVGELVRSISPESMLARTVFGSEMKRISSVSTFGEPRKNWVWARAIMREPGSQRSIL